MVYSKIFQRFKGEVTFLIDVRIHFSPWNICLKVIYYLRQESYVFGLVGCSTVCRSDNLKGNAWIRTQFSPEVCLGQGTME